MCRLTPPRIPPATYATPAGSVLAARSRACHRRREGTRRSCPPDYEAASSRRWRLIRPASCEDGRDGHGEDPQVAPQAEILDVVPLHGDPLVERELAASVDLHRA